MEIWIAGTLKEIKQAAATKLVTAVVTNPSVIANWTNGNRTLEDVCKEAVEDTGLPVYVQLYGPEKEDFIDEAIHLKKKSSLIFPKLPSTIEGISAAKELESDGHKTLVTTVVSVNQAYACAAAGIDAICPYFNRLQESGEDPVAFLKNVASIFRREKTPTRILPASVRTTGDIENALVAGCSGVIIFYPLFLEMFQHAVTKDSLKLFEEDWKSIPYEFINENRS